MRAGLNPVGADIELPKRSSGPPNKLVISMGYGIARRYQLTGTIRQQGIYPKGRWPPYTRLRFDR